MSKLNDLVNANERRELEFLRADVKKLKDKQKHGGSVSVKCHH